MPWYNRFRRHLLLLAAALALILAFCAVALYYFVHFRFADSLQFLVAQQSKGRYVLDAGEARFSVWDRTVLLRNARLRWHDTVNTDVWADIRIPELYFSMGSSWNTLFFRHTLLVDSMAIIRPVISLRILHEQANKPKATPPVTDLLTSLDSIMRRLSVRSFTLKDAAFNLTGPSGDPLHGDHINLFVGNFARGRGEVKVTLGRQHWTKPESRLTLDLARLAFDSRAQRFEVDSLIFSDHRDTTKAAYGLAAERLYFTSHQLRQIYRDGSLLLDSLVCVNPIVSLPAGRDPAEKAPATPRTSTPFFRTIGVGYVQVLNARLQTQDAGSKKVTASTKKANLRIFGLHVDGAAANPLAADSIGVDLHHLEFLSKDSAYRLTIEEFGLSGNDADFRQVQLAPTRPEPGRTVLFMAPLLQIKNISIPHLLRNHLRASGATLFRPYISLIDDRSRAPSANAALPPAKAQLRSARHAKMELFYSTLHGISQVIDAPYLDIVDGSHHFSLCGPTPVEVITTGLQAHILLNKLFLSDSLLDIKQALPQWKVKDFEFTAGAIHLSALDYELNGSRRSSTCRQARLTLASGWQVEATGLFWDALNWDELQADATFHIDSMHFTRLALNSGLPSTTAPTPSSPSSPPIQIQLDRLTVDSLIFARQPGLHFSAGDIRVTELAATSSGIHWRRAKAVFRNISWERPALNLRIAEASLDCDTGLTAKDLTVDATLARGPLKLNIPLATLTASIHSIDKNTLPLLALSIPRANFSYALTHATDTLRINGKLKLTLTSARIFPALSGALDLGWTETTAHRRTNDAFLSVSGLSGSFHEPKFDTTLFHTTDWRSWLSRTALTNARLRYSTKKLTADVSACSWEPTGRSLTLTGFSVSPALSRDSALKQATWQNDYVTVHGRSLTLTHIRLGGDPRRPSLGVPKLILDGVRIEASRDKHIPFHHGIEKGMPTKLLAAIHADLRIDTLLVRNSKVIYNEWPVTSSHWTTLSFDDLEGELLNIHTDPRTTHIPSTNAHPQPNTPDTLRLTASARFFDGSLRRFHYNESYTDSLSGFTARCSLSALDLTRLSSLLASMASVSVVRGHLDTVWSIWRGNRYAAFGTMGLHYDRLKVSVLNKKDPARRDFLPVVETWLANLLLPGRNNRESPIFFERDREKFVFNFWAKSQGSGVMSAVIRKKARAYKRRYAEVWQRYHLPPP